MSWLHKANEWLSRPFRGDEDGAPPPDPNSVVASPPGKKAATSSPQPQAATLANKLPADTDVTVRYIFGLTNPGIVKPPGDGALERVDDDESVFHSELVMAHFLSNRPEPASFPAMATQVIDVAEQPEADLTRLARLIEQDAAISAKVLQVANSALYHRDFEIATMKGAIGHLGMFAVANVAIGVACRSLYDSDSRAEFDLYPKHWKELFMQSMTVAYAASQFATDRHVGRADQLFLAGMFHDIGKTLALRSLCALIIEKRIPKLDDGRIDRVLERIHVDVGIEAHAAWALPKFLTTICKRHHDDEVVPIPDYVDLHIIRVISGLNALRLSGTFDRKLARQIRSSVHALGITQPQLREVTSSIRQANERVIEMFSLRG